MDIGTGSDEYDLTDDLPDANVFEYLVDGDEITTRICQKALINRTLVSSFLLNCDSLDNNPLENERGLLLNCSL